MTRRLARRPRAVTTSPASPAAAVREPARQHPAREQGASRPTQTVPPYLRQRAREPGATPAPAEAQAVETGTTERREATAIPPAPGGASAAALPAAVREREEEQRESAAEPESGRTEAPPEAPAETGDGGGDEDGQGRAAQAPGDAADAATEGPADDGDGAAPPQTARGRGTTRAERDGDGDGDGAAPLPAAVATQSEEPLAAPALAVPRVAAEWSAPERLDGGELHLPAPATRAHAAAEEPARESAPGEDAERRSTAASERRQRADPEQAERLRREAREQAVRAYGELASALRSEQTAFLGRGAAAMREMASGYQDGGSRVIGAYNADLSRVDGAATRARDELEVNAALAEANVTAATRRTRAAIRAAGRSAYGLIAAGDRAAAGRITSVVSGLVAGHLGAYNDAIRRATDAFDAAFLELNLWRDERETNYPIDGIGAMQGAKNESIQARVPRWSETEATQLSQRIDQKTEAWESSRDSTECSMSCSYRAALDGEHERMVTQTRESVATSLSEARVKVRRQSRAGKRALRELRDGYRERIEAGRAATRSRLNSQARMALGGLRGETRSAVAGVDGASRAAMPSYSRGAAGLHRSLEDAAGRGEEALTRTTDNAPARVLASVRSAGNRLDGRLRGNLGRARDGLSTREGEHADAAAGIVAEHEASLTEQGQEAAQRLDESAVGVREAFAGLASTVTSSAASWAQPLEVRMGAFIEQKRGEAATALTGLLTGDAGGGGGAAGGGAAAAGGGGAAGEAAPAPDCGHCQESGAEGGGASGGAAAGPTGLTAQVDEEIAHHEERLLPGVHFNERILETGAQVESALDARAVNVAQKFENGFAGSVDEEGAIAALRGLTAPKGRALDQVSYPAYADGTLDYHLRHYLDADSDDYAAASAYLRGDAVEGARLELADSTGFFNDDEARIEATMRALSPAQLGALGRDHSGVMEDVRDALGGTDREVFDALAAGNHALADAHRLRVEVNRARRRGEADALHSAIERYTGAPAAGDWRATQEMDPATRREAVVRELGGIVPDRDVEHAAGSDGVAEMSAEDRAVAFVTRDIQTYVAGGPHGEAQPVTLSITGANRDLAEALLRNGEGSVDARAARIGVEMQRSGEPPNATNIDRATFDPRFSADLRHASPTEREAHQRAAEQRARVVLLAAERYAGSDAAGAEPELASDPERPGAAMSDTRVTAARDRLIGQLEQRFGSDTTGAQLAAGLLTDARPTPETAALAMQHAMYSRTGTDEDLLFRFTERMNRDEIAGMRDAFRRNTGRSLDAELGVYGEGGTFTELSGDDRLRMERAMLGVARNDRERLEAAAFALEQQRRETGGFGAWLAEGTLAERVMSRTEQRLEVLAGGPVALSRRGELMTTLPNFNPQTGAYTGPDRDTFRATASVAQTVAENYSKRIDAFADVATTGIAILGAIAAAVITVATGGAAGPLIAAALAAGLASMAANYAIKGGRYGWEQAAIDLGMTAVQAITAGVGAQLGAAAQVASKGAAAASQASRTIASLARIFTGNPVVDQIIVGAITGSIGGLGGTLLTEQTWQGSSDKVIGNLFAGLLKGALSGAATAAVTNSIEEIGGKLAQGNIGRRLQQLAATGNTRQATRNMLLRGLGRGAISGVGGMAGRGAELVVDASRGTFRGDLGDAVVSMGEAGLRSALQGIGEGAGEAVGQRFQGQRLTAAADRIAAERESMGLAPLDATTLNDAAGDLLLLDQIGDSSALGRALNLDHVASNGGLAAAPDSAPPSAPRRPADSDAGSATGRAGDADGELAAPRLDPGETSEQAPRAAGGDDALPAVQHEAGAAPAPRAQPDSGGDGGTGGGRRPPAGGESDGDGPERLFRDLDDAEIDAAFDAAESRLMLEVPADALGADRRPLSPEAEASLPQRRRAAALEVEAEGVQVEANRLLERGIQREAAADIAAGAGNERRAAALRGEVDRLLDQAVALEQRALALRRDAEDFASGRRSAIDDLPGPGDLDGALDLLLTPMLEGLVGPELAAVQRAAIERHPELIPRLARELLSGEHGGRLVFRVESERSRALVHVDADGNVTVSGGASAHLNFGSFERAVEFLLDNSVGDARIISFEVDESWVRSLRGAAIPETDTGALHGEPRLVDVRAADDQIEVPAGLIPELERFIVPGSGRVHEIPGPRTDGGAGPGPDGADGAAAAIMGSRMQLRPETVIQHPRAALDVAAGEVLGQVQSIGPVTTRSGPDEPHLRLDMVDATEQPMSVRVEVAETPGSDVASFRRNPNGDDPAYIVSLSPRAPPEAHARALAHELAELRVHRVRGADGPDRLRAGARPGETASLSAHDRGRLAELEVLAARRAAVAEGDTAALRAVEADIDALAGHLGLLHAQDQDPRVTLALGALGADAPAREALGAARARARREGAEDQLGPLRPVDRDRPLSAADRRRIAELEDVAGRLAPERVGELSRGELIVLSRRLRELATGMGLLGSVQGVRRRMIVGRRGSDPEVVSAVPVLRPDPATTARAQRVLEVIGPDSAAGRALASLRDTDMPVGAGDALRPGRRPVPEADVPSAADLQRLEHLENLLRELPPRPPAGQHEPPHVRRQRHEAETLAASLGLVHGQHAQARADFALAHGTRLTADPALVQRLGEVRAGGRDNALLVPLRGTPDDIALVRRQRLAARAMGDDGLDARLARTLDHLLEGQRAEHLEQRIGEVGDRLARVVEGRDHPAKSERVRRLREELRRLRRDLRQTRERAMVPDLLYDRQHRDLVHQMFGDSPQYQPWGEFVGLYRELNVRTQSAADMGFPEVRQTGRLAADPMRRALRQNEMLAEWASGRYLSEQTGRPRALQDLEFIEAVPGVKQSVQDAEGRPVVLEPTGEVSVRRPDADGDRIDVTMTVEQARSRRAELIDEARTLRDRPQLAPEQQDSLKRIEQEVRDLSEGLGEAAGLRYAEQLPGGAESAVVARGAGNTDVVHIHGNPPVVTVIECKGGTSGLGSRLADQGGRRVRAEQGTPEYLRSLATQMVARGEVELGNAILEALNHGPPRIQVVVVRQPFGEGEVLLTPTVTDYPVRRRGL